MNSLEEINSLDQVADYLHITPDALARLKNAGKIGYLKIGRTVTFPRAAVEAYVLANTVEAALPPNPWGLAVPPHRGAL